MNLSSTIRPFIAQRADPWVYHHGNFYYFTASVPGYQVIELRRATSLHKLAQAEPVTIWHAPKTGNLAHLIWAPEIHSINHEWWIYFAASDDELIRDAHHHHRIFVLHCADADPLHGHWEVAGQVKTPQETFSLDATLFEHHQQLYMVWAQQEAAIANNSNLYLAKMANPTTLATAPTLLSIPEYPWEKIGFAVNEGPAVLIKDQKIWITYSASATDENYAMGLLWADVKADLLQGFSWHKAKNPVFTSSTTYQLYGPGHNSFTTDDDGHLYLVYHARPYDNHQITGDSLANPDRHTYVQPLKWDDQHHRPLFDQPGEGVLQ